MEAYQAYYNTNESNPASSRGGQNHKGDDKNHYMMQNDKRNNEEWDPAC